MDKKIIFSELEKIFRLYEKKLRFSTDGKSKCQLSAKKTIFVFNKEHKGIFFASAVIQGGFVGFYFFPIYTHVNEFKDLPLILKKCLKGKSCFHIKKNDAELMKSIKNLLKKGLEVYKKAGWV
jgi:hypothetical protein